MTDIATKKNRPSRVLLAAVPLALLASTSLGLAQSNTDPLNNSMEARTENMSGAMVPPNCDLTKKQAEGTADKADNADNGDAAAECGEAADAKTDGSKEGDTESAESKGTDVKPSGSNSADAATGASSGTAAQTTAKQDEPASPETRGMDDSSLAADTGNGDVKKPEAANGGQGASTAEAGASAKQGDAAAQASENAKPIEPGNTAEKRMADQAPTAVDNNVTAAMKKKADEEAGAGASSDTNAADASTTAKPASAGEGSADASGMAKPADSTGESNVADTSGTAKPASAGEGNAADTSGQASAAGGNGNEGSADGEQQKATQTASGDCESMLKEFRTSADKSRSKLDEQRQKVAAAAQSDPLILAMADGSYVYIGKEGELSEPLESWFADKDTAEKQEATAKEAEGLLKDDKTDKCISLLQEAMNGGSKDKKPDAPADGSASSAAGAPSNGNDGASK